VLRVLLVATLLMFGERALLGAQSALGDRSAQTCVKT
jgi:hypothetical protein